jgi:hypothetical protein
MDGSFHCIFNGIQSFEIKTIESEFIEDKRTALVKNTALLIWINMFYMPIITK